MPCCCHWSLSRYLLVNRMGLDNKSKHVYDLRRIEDVFACLEIISIARGALFGVNPEIAGKMEKISDALSAFSQLVLESGVAEPIEIVPEMQRRDKQAPAANPVAGMAGNILTDLTDKQKTTRASSLFTKTSHQEKNKTETGDMETGIIDILTGERIM